MRGELAPVDGAFLALWEREARSDIKVAISAGAPREAFTAERELLAEFRMVTFWGAQAFALRVDGTPHTVIIAGFNKRPHPDWGRYVNVFAVHTLSANRRRGGGADAYRALVDLAVARRCRRLVTTAGTYGGWRTHRALGWPSWGVNVRGEIVTDTDISGADEPPGVPPRSAKLTGPGRPLRPAEHAAYLTDPLGPYRVAADILPPLYRAEVPCGS